MAAISGILLKHPNGLVLRPVLLSSNSKYSKSTSSRDDAPPARPTAQPKPNSYFDPKLTAMKRGTGGRSSFNGVVCTVLGATGFVGRYVCNKLGKSGTQIIIPYRGDAYDTTRLKLVGDLGQVLFLPYDLRNEESLRKAMKYSNVVVNLIGRDWETKNFKFNDVHVKGARQVAKVARECGVKRLIHFSSLNVSEHPEGIILPDGSKFLSSKWEGEEAVKEEFPDVTIFRPADIYGQEDRFLNYYAKFLRRTFKSLPLWNRGERTIKQPVYVSDVANAVINAIRDPESAGKTYDAVGPKRYQLGELVDWIFRVMRRDESWGYKRTDMRWAPFFQLRVSMMDKFAPSWPIAFLGWDKIERDHVTDTPTPGNPTLEDLGVQLTDIESRADWELKPYRYGAYYDEDLGEFAPAEPPKTVA